MPVPGVNTLSNMTLQAKRRCDMVNAGFVGGAGDPTEWADYINVGCSETYDFLIRAYGPAHWYGKTATFVTDGTNYQFNLTQSGVFASSPIATDFYVLYGVDLQVVTAQPQSWIAVHAFPLAERNRWSFPTYITAFGAFNIHYALFADQLWIKPTPAAGQTIQLLYAPRFVPLVNAGDTFDGINGWEELAILRAAIYALQKEESDPTMLVGMAEKMEDRIRSIAAVRDAGEAPRTSDTRRSNGLGWGGMGPNGGGGWY